MQERLAALLEERKKLSDGGAEFGGASGAAHGSGANGSGGGGSGADRAVTSGMIEKEKHKLEVLKRRQERDIQQASSKMGVWFQSPGGPDYLCP